MHIDNKVKKNFGFGCMRLPMVDGQVDKAECSRMVDAFLEAGFNYFDTAHGYLDGKSELALKDCLTSRHPRESYILTNKLSGNFFQTTEEIRPLVQTQLDACGVEYFDDFPRYKIGIGRSAVERKCGAVGKYCHVGSPFGIGSHFYSMYNRSSVCGGSLWKIEKMIKKRKGLAIFGSLW